LQTRQCLGGKVSTKKERRASSRNGGKASAGKEHDSQVSAKKQSTDGKASTAEEVKTPTATKHP
jgi:hypothetical protein